MRFLHRIGKSTINQGITIPVDCQEQWMLEIGKGQSISAKLRFGAEEMNVVLRRINNAAGHLQFRYERKEHQRLREFFLRLEEVCHSVNDCIVEINEINQGIFEVIPIAGFKSNRPRLSIYSPVCHLFEHQRVFKLSGFIELTDAISDIDFVSNNSQKDYNRLIQEKLKSRDWSTEESVHDEIGLRCDFYKNGIWLEVEFGNARSYYQDYIKFLIAARFREYDYGILLCPTASFAGYLCELGKQRAHTNTIRNTLASYSGMMTYEKAIRELPCLARVS